MEEIAQLIKDQMEFQDPVVVVSAMGKTTNGINAAGELAVKEGRVRVDEIRKLHLDACEQLDLPASTSVDIRGLLRDLESLLDGVSMVRELTPRTKDLLASFGERLSCRILAAQLTKIGVPAVPKDAWTLGLRTIGGFGDSTVAETCYADVASSLKHVQEVPIVTGFVGHDDHGRVTTLGRGGSDLTATVLAACGGFDEVQVWKDVDGMMSADPRIVSNAVPVPFATYEEAAELAYFGAQLLHPVSMQPALKFGIPVRIKNSYNPLHPGTLIASTPSSGTPAVSEYSEVTAITTKRKVTVVDVVSLRSVGQSGFLATVFNVFEEFDLSVDVVATSEVSVSLTLDKKNGEDIPEDAVAKLSEIAQVEIKRDRSIVSLVGDNIKKESTKVLKECFDVLDANDLAIEMISQGASKVNVALVVRDDDADRLLPLLHDRFFS